TVKRSVANTPIEGRHVSLKLCTRSYREMKINITFHMTSIDLEITVKDKLKAKSQISVIKEKPLKKA
ncbi:hypothetical protein ACQP3L_38185, partial [Escherichia coli]